MYAMHICVQQF